ncbi:hypothetical protein [Ponticaulis sp.]|uniref:hypothetical protein n=1 Tax=Ponticaulis sp. TaxID=2020902 RepID=UPI00260CA8F8|nr:hypothetical protein [Ponticaulis sp.]MDF1680621.1 hypothetical protein [Ponticaulis sp.]
MPESFKASVQDNHWLGTSAADAVEGEDWNAYLQKRSLLRDGEKLVGIRAWFGEHHPMDDMKDVYVSFYLVQADEWDSVSQKTEVPVRVVQLEIEPSQFIRRFRRMEIALGDGALDLSNRDFDISVY